MKSWNERIDALLHDDRLRLLEKTQTNDVSFSGMGWRLPLVKQRCKEGKMPDNREQTLICEAEKHIKHMKHNIRRITVNGEDHDVIFGTE